MYTCYILPSDATSNRERQPRSGIGIYNPMYCANLCCVCTVECPAAKCVEGSIRLVRNESHIWSDGEGLVQICVASEWRYVCNDRWNENAARVVCKELCMLTEGELQQQNHSVPITCSNLFCPSMKFYTLKSIHACLTS